ncbi:hypothetical protein KFK09_011940 [Dendrobium nobile]|uniref:Uncharacterized protein n=1 Tax=Dendrobium nobile TaxID=94219 RepID=A0A8T3BFX2_DENNO|nr:hypothetical protein KFK09_011940 [Dendrobium nobile]
MGEKMKKEGRRRRRMEEEEEKRKKKKKRGRGGEITLESLEEGRPAAPWRESVVK